MRIAARFVAEQRPIGKQKAAPPAGERLRGRGAPPVRTVPAAAPPPGRTIAPCGYAARARASFALVGAGLCLDHGDAADAVVAADRGAEAGAGGGGDRHEDLERIGIGRHRMGAAAAGNAGLYARVAL